MKELIDSMLEDKNGRKTTDQNSEWQTTSKKVEKKQYSTEKPPTKSKPQAVKSQQSSTNKMNENKLPKNNVLVLGNSQIRRLDSAKLQHIKLAGVGGLKSGSILTTHKTSRSVKK